MRVKTWVYFIKSGDAVKIGISKWPRDRIGALQTAHHAPLELLGSMPGDRNLEGRIHQQFEHLRLKGEWFRAEPELLQFIKATLSVPDESPNKWEIAAEQFAAKARQETRQGKLSETARSAANYLGGTMHMLKNGETPELLAQLVSLTEAFAAARISR